MIRKIFIFLAVSCFTIPYAYSTSIVITDVVVFGDSLSDRGFTQGQGGFSRFSNGRVWAEYFARPLCKTCLQDYAWGGAKSDRTNFNNLDWSGFLWQVEQYTAKSNLHRTLHIIWIGSNDLILGDTDPALPPVNIMHGIDQLIAKGAKHIAVFNLPDFSLLPAYNSPGVPESERERIRHDIGLFNQTLDTLLQQKQSDYPHINLYSVNYATFFNTLISRYENKVSPWQGTFSYPEKRGYFWWDEWHPMTSVHRQIARYARLQLRSLQLVAQNS